MNNTKEYKTKLVYETEQDRLSWESPYIDSSIDDLINAFYALMVGGTWQPETILRGMQDFVNEHKYMLNDEDDE